MERQIGLTTQQMQAAPKGAVFVWCNERLEYPRALAHKMGRDDLNIVSPHWLERIFVGHALTGLVVDHAARLNDRERYGLDHARTRVLSNGQGKPPAVGGSA